MICSFWLATCLAQAGEVSRAREVFERVAAHANDVGLLAEEIDPRDGSLLGNFPQAFSRRADHRRVEYRAGHSPRGRTGDDPMKLQAGCVFPDLDLPDHTGRDRHLSEVASGDPVVLLFSRGWWCPKEQRHLREMTALQDEFEVAYTRIVVVSVDAPEVQSALRAGLGARFVFLSDAERRWLEQLGLLEESDTLHEPYRPTAFALYPDLTIHRVYDGYWYWGRPTAEDLRQDMRAISRAVREDFDRR